MYLAADLTVDDGYCFIVNPAAGGGLAGRNWPQFREKLSAARINHCYYLSEYSGHGYELAKAAYEAGERHFIAVGGDGTANEILNGLLGVITPGMDRFSLGTVPWGTGNDWASYYGFSNQTEALIRMLQEGSKTQQDLGRVVLTDGSGATRNHYFLNCAGTGIDSYLLNEMTDAQGSRFRYFLFLLKCLRKFRATPVTLSMDKDFFQGSTLLLEICLGKFAGAGMRFAPNAVANDGLFEVLLIDEMNILQVLRSLVYLYNGKINQHRAVHRWQCRSVSIEARTGDYLQCDGELVGRLQCIAPGLEPSRNSIHVIFLAS